MSDSLLGGIASGVGSLVSGILGSDASEDAADAQTNAANENINFLDKTYQGFLEPSMQTEFWRQLNNLQSEYGTNKDTIGKFWDYTTGAINNQQNLIRPYSEAGTNALSAYMKTLLNPTDTSADPYYNYLQSEAAKAVQNSASAKGGLLSGATLKALQDRSQNIAQGYRTNRLNELLQGVNVGQTATNQAQNVLSTQLADANNSLNSRLGLSQNYTNALNQISQNLTGNRNALWTNYGAQRTGQYTNAGAAQAGGSINSANAITGGISSGLNNALLSYALLPNANKTSPTSTYPNWGSGMTSFLYGNGWG